MLRSKYIPSNTSVVLIDYSNYDPFQNCTNTEGDFLNFLVQILSSIENNETEYYLIRLYGGWHENGVLTNLGSKLQQLISSVKIFPTNRKGKVVRGEIELASYESMSKAKDGDGDSQLHLFWSEIHSM